MKLKIQSDMIRLRLHPDEVDALYEKRSISESIVLVNDSINIWLKISQDQDIDFSFSNGQFAFSLPESLLEEWENTDKIGFSHYYENLEVVIEKEMPRNWQPIDHELR